MVFMLNIPAVIVEMARNQIEKKPELNRFIKTIAFGLIRHRFGDCCLYFVSVFN